MDIPITFKPGMFHCNSKLTVKGTIMNIINYITNIIISHIIKKKDSGSKTGILFSIWQNIPKNFYSLNILIV